MIGSRGHASRRISPSDPAFSIAGGRIVSVPSALVRYERLDEAAHCRLRCDLEDIVRRGTARGRATAYGCKEEVLVVGDGDADDAGDRRGFFARFDVAPELYDGRVRRVRSAGRETGLGDARCHDVAECRASIGIDRRWRGFRPDANRRLGSR